jgi:hypothetical protein
MPPACTGWVPLVVGVETRRHWSPFPGLSIVGGEEDNMDDIFVRKQITEVISNDKSGMI